MKKAKVITICGSLKFTKEMQQVSEQLELAGNCVLSVIYPTKTNYTQEEIALFDQLHRQKIFMSDAIFVVNVNGYIGESTRNEIEFAKSLNKEVQFFT
ncbi:MAG: hypothetical protein LBV67_11855 [Streptococcaceae bacterium]|jgi:hypothetical protein|nr:hypothetical protein [Streptococcaceae bacterium]